LTQRTQKEQQSKDTPPNNALKSLDTEDTEDTEGTIIRKHPSHVTKHPGYPEEFLLPSRGG
jgi:hypothetical protein